MNPSSALNCVSFEEGYSFALSRGVQFVETSCLRKFSAFVAFSTLTIQMLQAERMNSEKQKRLGSTKTTPTSQKVTREKVTNQNEETGWFRNCLKGITSIFRS